MKNSLFIIFTIISITSNANDSLVLKLDVKASYFTTDHLMNIYFINDKNEIIKYSTDDSSEITYSNKQLGTPTFIDATNPLKLLVFYPDQSAIVQLDNKLAELNILRFNNAHSENTFIPTAVCREQQSDNIWIFDDLSRKLIQLDEQGTQLKESESFTLLFNETVIPVQLIFAEQKLYLTDTEGNIYIFDSFANYYSELNLHINGYLQMINSNFIFINENKLHVFDTKSLTTKIIEMPVENCVQANMEQEYLILRTPQSILIYNNR